MLHNCGLVFEAIPADIAEEEITEDMRAGGKGAYDIAQELAKKKALAVSKDNPEALVIGSDQILEFEDELLDKATNREEAIEKLKLLRGKTHRLFSAVVV